MSLFISPFKAWIAALVAFFAIEAAILVAYRPNEFDRTNFLQFALAGQETAQRLFMYEKIKAFADSQPTIVQSGDSSGFYGIDPRQIMKYLPAGVTYLNASCCANLGYRGYYNVLKFFAERNKSVRYIVLHVTPYTLPVAETWESGDGAALWADPTIKVFGEEVHREFLSAWRVFQIPSLALRRQVTEFSYYLNGVFRDPKRPLAENPNYLKFLEIFRETRGWMPESDVRVDVPPIDCPARSGSFFDIRTLSKKLYLQEVLESYAALARELNVTLVVVFQPVACKTGPGSAEAVRVVERFKRVHPDVEIPFPLIETWPSSVFSVPAHVKRERTQLINDRLGKAMAEIVARRGL